MTNTASFGVEPYIFVTDIEAVLPFYVSQLGFQLAISQGGPAQFAQVTRQSARLNLRRVDSPVLDPIRREAEELLSATVTVDDINGVYAEFSAAGVSFFQHLHTAQWGARTFIVRDPEGNLIMFAA